MAANKFPAMIFFYALTVLAVVMSANAYGAETANLAKGAVFPGGQVINLAGMSRAVNGERDGVTFVHNFNSTAGGIVSNNPGLPSEKLYIKNSWRIQCKTDEFEDKSWCEILRIATPSDSVEVHQVFYTDGELVCIPGNTFPGRKGLVRVDKHPPESTVEGGNCLTRDASRRVLEQMKNAETIRTRLYAWPYENARDVRLSTYGLSVAIEMMNWMRQSLE